MNPIPKKHTGFTLVELMVTISIAAVLLRMAVPTFNAVITSNKLTAYANKLVGTINFARSEAVKRGIQVTIRRRGTTASTWEGGWDVFVDNNANGTLDGTDVLLKSYEPLTNGYTLRTGGNFTCWLAYTSAGVSRGSGTGCTGGPGNDSFNICDSSATAANSRLIAINAIGRPSPSRGTATCP
jgi:type IV fimbrial biogenesis protein FimT